MLVGYNIKTYLSIILFTFKHLFIFRTTRNRGDLDITTNQNKRSTYMFAADYRGISYRGIKQYAPCS